MNSLGRKLNKNEAKDPRNSIEYWRNQIEEHGVVYVQKSIKSSVHVSDVWTVFAQDAVDEYEKNIKNQEDIKSLQQESRAEKNSALNERTLNWTAICALCGVAALAIAALAYF